MRAILVTLISLLFITIPSDIHSASNPVTQAVITTGITSDARPETDNLSVVDFGVGKVIFYTEIVGLQGQTVQHQWIYGNEVMASISMKIGSSRSINWSQTSVGSGQTGRWIAKVVDQSGQVLASRDFDVIGAAQGLKQVVQQRSMDLCSERLAELQAKADENPSVDYYKFLYEQQVKRCQ